MSFAKEHALGRLYIPYVRAHRKTNHENMLFENPVTTPAAYYLVLKLHLTTIDIFLRCNYQQCLHLKREVFENYCSYTYLQIKVKSYKSTELMHNIFQNLAKYKYIIYILYHDFKHKYKITFYNR